MKSWRIPLLVLLVLLVPALLAWGTTPTTQTTDQGTFNMDAGQDAFVAAKCLECHTVTAKGLARTGEVDPEEDPKPPDLSKVGAADGITAEFLGQYLIKRAQRNGRKHPKKYRGDKLDVIIAWLVSLK